MANPFLTSELLKCASRYPVVKGDVQGHVFHGNQWTGGQGGEMPANIAAFQRNLKEFYDAGGKIERVDNENKISDLYRTFLEMRETPEYKAMDARHQQGIRFLGEAAMYAHANFRAANSEINPNQIVSSHLFVARNKDNEIVAAVNVAIHSPNIRLGDGSGPILPSASIGYLGSTGKMPGAATALMEQAIQMAADKGLTMTYQTTADSHPYHEMLGVERLNNRALEGFSAESAAKIAALPNPKPTIIKAEDFIAEALLRPLANYPVSKVGNNPASNKSALLSEKANSLRVSTDGDLSGSAAAHRKLAAEHSALASQLTGDAAQKHRDAATAHTEAADEIDAIRPVEGGSIASNALTGDKAHAFAGMAARASNAALQATINQKAMPVTKMVKTDYYGSHAKEMLAKFDTPPVDFRAMGGFHLGYGIRHQDMADQLQSLAYKLRGENGNVDNAATRAWMQASVAHRDAMQAHYTAGRINDAAAFANTKVEGATPSTHHSMGNCRYASTAAADASQKADEATEAAQNIAAEPQDD